jgi:hypothetical protein
MLKTLPMMTEAGSIGLKGRISLDAQMGFNARQCAKIYRTNRLCN